MALSDDEVRLFVLDQVADSLAAVGLSASAVPDDFDLLTSGVIDSLGLLELVAAIEERFGLQLDLQGLAVDDLGVVGPFTRYIAARVSSGAHEQSS